MKILYVSTISNTINAFMIPHIDLLINRGHSVEIACKIEKPIREYLVDKGVKVHNVNFKRSPFSVQNIIAYNELKKIVKKNDYDLVHTHTPIASVITRIACKKFEEVKVIYTAHGFQFFKGARLLDWLLYYPIERYLSRFTDLIITINNEDFERSKKFKSNKVECIPSVGLDLNKYGKKDIDKEKKCTELGLNKKDFHILSVGELSKRKNHEVIIKALSKIENTNISFVICGEGPQKVHLKNLSKKMGLENQVKLLGHRSDLPDIYNVTDIFAFPSKREGLGMAALEAMSVGLPIITSNIQGILDYSENRVTGFNCDPNKVECFAESIEMLYKDEKIRKGMSKYNKELVKKFDINSTLKKLEEVYIGYESECKKAY